ncbi:hypothetical protein FA10DRAFT_185097 [Acaromyces ingoldii]|uniref:Uncharacterized protein n=1 Tax=Acaromyces ingoldii TaxID=215250 RepID=A0A316YCL1_9BASI|nr:hypothetical protein FA10DRAFT_185097 [Acaromyces ingoldii]PWN87440.1 hypothetical protein FA10DRAFT_185097 [Acaromyces ingoldii]
MLLSNPSRFGRMPTPMKKTNVVPLPQVEKGGDVDLDLLSPFCRSDARCRVDCALHARARKEEWQCSACRLPVYWAEAYLALHAASVLAVEGGFERVRLNTSQFPGPSGGRCRRSSERARACQASPFLFNFLFSPPFSFPLFPSSLLAAFSLGSFHFSLHLQDRWTPREHEARCGYTPWEMAASRGR